MRVAIIGTGIAGSAAAYALSCGGGAHLTLYEKERRLGGHSATVDIDYDGQPISVDTGFIVYNQLNYPNLTALFAELEVATEASDMSLSLSCDDGRFEWCGRQRRRLRGLFAQPRNLVSPRFWLMLREVLRFQRTVRADLAADRVPDVSLREYLDRHGFSAWFRRFYLLPMGGAIWSASPAAITDFPARRFLAFLDNHKLLDFRRPQWRTVSGGSRRYVERLGAATLARTWLDNAAASVTRSSVGVVVENCNGHRDRFDQVIIATHAPDALALLSDASAVERDVLGAFKTTRNVAYLHRDIRLMPKRRAAWAAWNVLRREGGDQAPVAVTYCMNILQNIDPDKPLFVSLNPPFRPDPALTFATMDYAHPLFDAGTVAAQARLSAIQGCNRTWFCGAWTGYGFHEDGLVSGLEAAEALGGRVSWRPTHAALAQEAAA